MSKLVLIDGSSYLYRAFHALPPLTGPDGSPTGALFGVVNMLRTTLKAKPDYAAFVLDAPGPTFRDDLYPDYKANRPPMPDDLRGQIEPMLAIVEALGMPILRIPGVEADDVIGTLALQAHEKNIDVEISTSDKDFAQLVRPGVALVNTMSNSRMDTDEKVIEKFGVRADQIVDYLSLMGDAVDNIPGVDKCGPKTAAKWLAEYDTLDQVIASADQIKGKIGENLRGALDRLPLNRQLVTIKTDVELPQTLQDLKLQDAFKERLAELYTQYGFHQALRDLNGDAAPVQATGRPAAVAETPAAPLDPVLAEKGRYELILERQALAKWIEKIAQADLICFDTETDALDSMQAGLVGISLCVKPGEACYIPLAHVYPGAPEQLPMQEVLDALKPALENPEKAKLGQNGKYDLHVLRRHGVSVQGYTQDTMLASFVLAAGLQRHDMDSLAKRHLNYDTIKFTDVAGKGAKQISFAQVQLEEALDYAAEDADITLRLHRELQGQLQKIPSLMQVYTDIEMPLVPVLERIEANGVLLDSAELKRQSTDLAKRMHLIEQNAYALAGRTFNLDSPKQLGALLFDEMGLSALVKTPKGQPSTNEEALEAIADEHELPRMILEYRGMAKLRSTYTEKLPEMVNPQTGRVHTSYHQAGAATGRLSSSDPNLQNIPIRTEDGRRVRKAFIAPEGRQVLACDYSQIELRIMAHLSQDPGLLRAFRSGQDVHRATAAEVFDVSLEEVSADQRRAAKAINFGLMYGMSAFGLARQLHIARGDAQDYIAQYFKRYPGVRDYMERTREFAREHGYVETLFGRRLHLDMIASRNANQRAGAERAAINAPMQGTAADIIKRAMLGVHQWIGEDNPDISMLMQVHDELVFEVNLSIVETATTKIQEIMASAAELSVPLIVDTGVGANWDEAH